VGPQAVELLGYPVADWSRENFWIDHVWPKTGSVHCVARGSRGGMKEWSLNTGWSPATDARCGCGDRQPGVRRRSRAAPARLHARHYRAQTGRSAPHAARFDRRFSDDAIIGKTLDGIIIESGTPRRSASTATLRRRSSAHISILAPAQMVDEVPGFLERIRHGEKVRRCETVRGRRSASSSMWR
jgi:hypothetical protein